MDALRSGMRWAALAAVFACAVALSCRPAGRPERTGRVRVFASIPPVAEFVRRVGGERVEVEALVGRGQDPHSFEVSPQAMARLAEADLYVAIGMPFEGPLLEKIGRSRPGLRIVDARRGVALRDLSAEEAAHGHEEHAAEGRHEGHGHGHAEGEPDPHIWLDPRRVKQIAANIAEALAETDPAHAEEYRANLAAFQNDLDALDRRLAEALAPVKGRTFFVFHPAFGYLAEAYGLVQRAVEVEGKAPSARQVAALIEQAKREGVRVIFVQPQFSRASAERIAREIGGAVVAMDPLAEDYMANLERMAEAIRRGLAPAGPAPREGAGMP